MFNKLVENLGTIQAAVNKFEGVIDDSDEIDSDDNQTSKHQLDATTSNDEDDSDSDSKNKDHKGKNNSNGQSKRPKTSPQ